MSRRGPLTLAIALVLVIVRPLAAATPEEVRAWLRDVDAVRQPYLQAVISVRQTERVGGVARSADEFGGGRCHLTTRQNIQYHFVTLAKIGRAHV